MDRASFVESRKQEDEAMRLLRLIVFIASFVALVGGGFTTAMAAESCGAAPAKSSFAFKLTATAKSACGAGEVAGVGNNCCGTNACNQANRMNCCVQNGACLCGGKPAKFCSSGS